MARKIIMVFLACLFATSAYGAIAWRWEYGASPESLDRFMRDPGFPSDVTILDDVDFIFGTNSDWLIQYDEGIDNQLLFITANTSCTATTDPMFEILVGASPTADQEVFGVSKGTQASNTSLLALDEDGDLTIAGSILNIRAIALTFPADNGDAGEQLQTDGSGGLTWEAAGGTGTASGSDTQIQYNDGGTNFGGIASFIYDDTRIECADDFELAFGTDADWIINYDTTAAQLLLYSNANGATATTDPMFQVLADYDTASGGNITVDQDIFGVAKGTQATNVDLFVVDEDGDVTIAGDEAVAGSTTITTNLTVNGDTDIGNAATDTLTITASIDGDVYIDDTSGATPSLIFRDGTDETATFIKADSGYLSMTTPAADGFSVLTGNLKVGGGTPGVSLNGEDVYVTGTFEVDGSTQFDGAVSNTSTASFTGDVTLDDQISGTFASNDEEILITNTATTLVADNLVEFVMAAQTTNTYILALTQTPDADADNDYLICADTTGTGVAFVLSDGGGTGWTLDADKLVRLDADSTEHTQTAGVLDIDLKAKTDNTAAINLNVNYMAGGGDHDVAGLLINLDDDADAAAELIGIEIASSDDDASAVTKAIKIQNSVAVGAQIVTGVAGVALDIDAPLQTQTAGTVDIDFSSVTTATEAVNIDVDVGDTQSGAEIITGVLVDLDDDTASQTSVIRGFSAVSSDIAGEASTVVTGFYTSGCDAALAAINGYVAIGAVASADVTPSDDDLYVEGTVEVDGATRLDGTTALNAAVTVTLPAASYVKLDGETTANTTTNGVLEIRAQSATATNKAIYVDYQLEETASTAFGLYMDLDDDTNSAGETYSHIYLDNSAAGSADNILGLVTTNAIDDAISCTLGVAGQVMVVDAETAENTITAGIFDIGARFSEDTASVFNINVESEADGATEEVYGIHIEMDDDADNADNEIHGLHVAGDGTNGTGLQHAIVTSGANIDAGLWCETGYLRVGTGSSADLTLGAADNAFIEGTLEVDGNVRLDGVVDIYGTLDSGTNATLPWETNSKTKKRVVIPLSYVSATEIRAGEPGFPALGVGLAGVDEIGTTEGYINLGEGADFVRFGLQLPDDFIDAGNAGDLLLEFDLHEQAGEECNLEVRIFEYGNTTAIITDTIVIADAASRAWSGLVTLSSGIGADADITAEDVLLIELTQEGADDLEDVYVYGARLTYLTGIENTQ